MEPAAEEFVFKKPKKRANMRKRERTDDAEPDDDDGAAGETSTSLESVRELQRQRQRAKGVSGAFEAAEASNEEADAVFCADATMQPPRRI